MLELVKVDDIRLQRCKRKYIIRGEDPFHVQSVDIVNVQAFNQNMVGEGKPIRVRVEFSLEDPLGGVHFVLPEVSLLTAVKDSHGYHKRMSFRDECSVMYNVYCLFSFIHDSLQP